MAKGKLIAVSGPPGCGKTTLALKLAQEIHELTQEKVIYLSPDTLIPAMGHIFPRRDKESLYSLGAALDNVDLAITDLLGVMATTTAMPNLGYMGYTSGEGPHSHAIPQEKKIILMFQLLQDKFDYIFVDCDRNREDLISSLACGLCDHLIQMINPDIKSIAYYGFEQIQDRAIQVLNMLDNDVYLPLQEIKARFPGIEYTILYSRPAKMQMYNGELMDLLKDTVYRKSIKPIIDLLMVEPEPVPEEQPDADEEQPTDTLAETQNDDFWR